MRAHLPSGSICRHAGKGLCFLLGETQSIATRGSRGHSRDLVIHIDVFCLVFIWTAVSVIVVAVSCGIRALATLSRGEESTLCRDGTWLWLLWEDLELS
jgi:hypothetical protein